MQTVAGCRASGQALAVGGEGEDQRPAPGRSRLPQPRTAHDDAVLEHVAAAQHLPLAGLGRGGKHIGLAHGPPQRRPHRIGQRRASAGQGADRPTRAATSSPARPTPALCHAGPTPTNNPTRRTRLASEGAGRRRAGPWPGPSGGTRPAPARCSPPRRQSPSHFSNSTSPPIIRAIRSAARLSCAGSGGGASNGTVSARPAARGRRGTASAGSASASWAAAAAVARPRRAIHSAANAGRPGPSATCPPAHSSSRATACLHGYLRLGHEQRGAAEPSSTAVWYGSPGVPTNRPQTASASHPVADHLAGTAARRAADSARAPAASASTSSIGQRVFDPHRQYRGGASEFRRLRVGTLGGKHGCRCNVPGDDVDEPAPHRHGRMTCC